MEVVLPWLATAGGVTVSGGEPFDQPEALLSLLRCIRTASADDILVYSGYAIETLGARLADFTGLIDALITDPFSIDTPQTLALRGSDNQRLHCLSALGEQKFRSYERPSAPSDRVLDVRFDGEGDVWMAGIPQRGDLRRLMSLLAAGGHAASSTEDKASKRRRN